MKILHIIPNYIPAYRYGGPVKVTHELCRALARKGQEVLVLTTNVNRDRDLNNLTGKVHKIEEVKIIYYPVKFLRWYLYSTSLSRAIKENVMKFDVVHIHSVYLYPTLAASYWCRNFKVPYIISPLGMLDPDMIRLRSYLKKMFYIKLIEQRNIKNAALIHLASIYEKEKFLSLGFDKTPMAVIPHGISIEEYEQRGSSGDLRAKYTKLQGKKIILFLGRIHFKKGLDILALAFKKIMQERNDTYLVIAGPDERGYASKVKEMFAKYNLMENVIFTGMLLNSDKLSAFYNSDVFVLPSRGENFGLAVLEAMACKLPVVITNRVGLYPDVKERKAGIITECDSEQIAVAILKLLDNEALRKSMGESGRRLIEDRFTWDKIVDKMIKIYDSVIHKRPLEATF
ncbi:MAG: glycosyltransferase [Candidatus Omnitrophica bacterium]|nr:glycosyltransferase [Candidatus Omnitrophota bacterium]